MVHLNNLKAFSSDCAEKTKKSPRKTSPRKMSTRKTSPRKTSPLRKNKPESKASSATPARTTTSEDILNSHYLNLSCSISPQRKKVMKKKRQVASQIAYSSHHSSSPLRPHDQKKMAKLETQIFDAILHVINNDFVISPKKRNDDEKKRQQPKASELVKSPPRPPHTSTRRNKSNLDFLPSPRRREDTSLERLIRTKLDEINC